ncbi:hypothetical protein [Neptuniibacter caesariensis]|uniref:Uncharacterized protein n=1 Tax=Neptuniibacter caesariensis TaxID=207954 RepID=A0A7U8GTI2_NEPCE|nr:hypothetical protein [Neptuniibacter caesariensis]EAR62170.1 hypothetical protein MED92_10704 [Oceanospirillum sp. MED92] [Neptuniibacter caesariensis]
MSTYEHTRNGIEQAGFNPEIIEQLASDIAGSKTIAQAENNYFAFETEAEKLPWPWDHDFGALVLQKQAVGALNEVAKYMLSQAIRRAQWCATCATSGGEGLARASHMKELEVELAKIQLTSKGSG